MIAIGAHFGGPGAKESPAGVTIRAAMKTLGEVRGAWIGTDDFGPCDPQPNSGPHFEKGSMPAVNVVFYVPGSLSGYEDLKRVEAARFSRKKKLLLVAVPVPKEEVDKSGSVEFVIGALHQANRIASETFARKGTEPFDLEKADAIVEKVRQSLVDQGFS